MLLDVLIATECLDVLVQGQSYVSFVKILNILIHVYQIVHLILLSIFCEEVVPIEPILYGNILDNNTINIYWNKSNICIY